jgi:hypothetical protein
MKKSRQAGERLVVYVGAKWCEPCTHFQEALKSGGLGRDLPDVVFLKFDHDKDEARLEEAGYGGRMLPRFVVPGVYGRASERRFEGSIKGPEAVGNIVPRLKQILSD